MRVTYKTKQLGVSLVEMMATISIMALILAGLANLSNRYLDEARAVSAGIHLRMISDAMNDYHRDKFAAITAVATDTVPAKIKVETLIADGYLPPTFNPVNEYGQTVCALTLEPTADRLETLVVTEGGLTLTDGELHSMIDPLGASAGALFTANPANP
ncbi:MAG: shufflon system plasmid conjugative transfer pilus tip adhesin PilV, partial [Gammaproteobacteria bacterium]|nr:shufflon system plasmid conjugative transfer pilus tip adhesin PilV [Gammaproteobacteria bacterium]